MLTGKRLKIIWTATAITALLLAAASVRLIQLRSGRDILIGQQIYITGNSQLVLLRESAFSSASITAILERGMTVTVVEIETNTRVPWLLVESDTGRGWIEASQTSQEPPE